MAAPSCRLYLFTPTLTAAELAAFAPRFAEALSAGDVASALVRVAPLAQGDAGASPSACRGRPRPTTRRSSLKATRGWRRAWESTART